MKPIEKIFERAGLPAFGLPPALAASYGGDFGLGRPGLYANFVSSADGVVALSGDVESGRIVGGDSEPDRFVMGLLRASADAVLIGAGTFRKAHLDTWSPEGVYPAAGSLFADLRRQLGLRPQPLLVVVTASGNIDRAGPALADALVVTTTAGASRLGGALPASARVVAFDANLVGGRALMRLLAAEKLEVVLTEGGPALFGQLLAAEVVDELFLTSSPRIFGRRAGDGRKGLVDGIDLGGMSLDLLGARRHESHLFLRYAVAARSGASR